MIKTKKGLQHLQTLIDKVYSISCIPLLVICDDGARDMQL
jgi:hypothetical protein